MKVLHVFDHTIPLHSGYTFRSLALLRGQRQLGWQTFHLSSPKHSAGLGAKADGALQEEVDGWRFHRTPELPRSTLPGIGEFQLMAALQRRIEQVAREVGAQLIHAHSPVLNALPALKAGRRLGVPVVYEVRAFWEDAAVDHGSTAEGSLRYRLTRTMETHALKRADHVFTICEGLRSDIVARGLPASKVTVIPNAVDIERFTPSRGADPALQQQLGLVGCTVLGFIGSFYAYEGLDLLLDALPAMRAQRPDVRVLLVGGGPQEAALRAQVQRLGLQDVVLMPGRVPHAEVDRYYDLVDLLVYPRHSMRLTELVTPLKPLEAMAQERLLLASDVGGHRELIRDGQTGRLFRAGDADALARAALELLDQRAQWPQLRAAGRRFVETERNWAVSTAAYRPVFDALLARP
ncbi:MAG: TIGR04063 family PEP-CTERM/XrtA system glycosyltransferase [Inhella sp.]